MSGAVDGDVRRTVARGRETLGAMLSAAQTHLQKVAVVFLVFFLGSFYALQLYVWDLLKANLFSKLPPAVAKQTAVVATTPFAVPLLQAKVSLVIGGIASVPVLLYYSRDALKERGCWPDINARWKIVVVFMFVALLFLLGISYGYFVFFPLMFEFLARNAVKVGFKPTYSIVLWAQFVFTVGISFGLVAQLPLVMTGLSLSGIVPYETFRDKWKHAIVVAFTLGALFTPPDPFTQILWAVPMTALFALSLGLTKLITTLQRGGSAVRVRGVIRETWLRILGIPLLLAGVVAAAIKAGFGGCFNLVIVPQIPFFTPEEPVFKYIGPMLGLPRNLAIAVVAGAVFVVVVVLAVAYYTYEAINVAAKAAHPEAIDPADIDIGELDEAGVRAAPIETFTAMSEQEATAQASMAMSDGDPNKAQAILDRFDAAVDVAELDEEGVRAAPGETFATMSEQEATEEANTAMSEGDPEKARAILDRFDAAHEGGGETDTDNDLPGEFEPAVENEPEPSGAERMQETFTRTTTGIVDSFTTEETTEDDIGGYYYDIAFVLDSLRSRVFLLLGLFMAVLAGTFFWLYKGGIGGIKADFLSRLPAAVRPAQINIVTLHPVEALIFEIKISTLFAALAVLPFALYYAWPALEERGFTVGGDRRVLFGWAVALLASLIGGIAVGYAFVAPTVISWLAGDVIQAHMVVAYRISAAGWLVFFTTAGIGLLAMIPVTMVLFHRARLVPYRAMRGRWREVTVGVFALTAYLSPRGVFVMFIIGIPVMVCYGLGLGLLWIYTLGGRRTPSGSDQRESAD